MENFLTKTKFYYLLLIALLSTFSSTAQIYQHNFDNLPDPPGNPVTAAPTVQDANITSSQWTPGAGTFSRSSLTAYSLANNNGNQFDLTLNIASGYSLNITGISLKHRTYPSDATYKLQVNGVDYGTPFTINTATNSTNQTITVPDLAGPVIVSLVYVSNTGTQATLSTAIDDFTITGSVTPLSTIWVNDNSISDGGTTSAVGNDDNPGTQALPLLTINKAIAVAQPGTTIKVDVGTYSEAITISKSLTISGPNAGVSGTGTRSAEAKLSDGSITVTGSPTVVLDGMYIYQTNNTAAVVSPGGDATVTIQNSKFERVGSSPGQNVRAIVTSSGSGVKTIKDNLFTGSTAGGLFSAHVTWQGAIYVNGTASTVSITGNTFENIRSALNLDDYNNGITVSGNTFNTNGTHLSFGGSTPTAGSYTLGANNFKAPADGLINLSNVDNSFRLDITSSTLNGAAFNTLPMATLYLVESAIYHRGRSGRKGLITYVSGNQYVVKNLTTIQSAIDYGTAGNVIHIKDGSFTETLTVNKNLTFEGANKDVCGTASRSAETILVAPATASGVITLSGSVTATFNGVLIDGMGVAYLTQPNQGLTLKNSVLELDFIPAQNNIYAASNYLQLDCNLLKAVSGSNDGSSSHIFVGDGTFSAINNTFTSVDALTAITGSTTSLPVWLNITANTSNFSLQNNLFSKIDIGILLASNAGNGLIQNNEFSEAKRATYTGNPGNGYGTGIALFGNYTPSGAVIIQKNKFYDGETGIRTSTGDATNSFPSPGLLTITNNSFVNLSSGAFRIGNSYNNSANALAATCNWFENAGVVTGNPANITYIPKLASGVDDDPAIGFQQNAPVCTGPVHNVTKNTYYATIQSAIDASVTTDGDYIVAIDGTYNENVTVTKSLTIAGTTTTGTILAPATPGSGVGIAINAANVVITKLTVDKYNYGITINASGTAHKLIDIKSTNNAIAGIAVPYGSAPESANISGLEISNATVTGNVEGLEVFATTGGSKVFDNVTIKNSNFSNNTQKGIYVERANNLTIDNVTINNSGTDPGNGNNNNGIDINLKYASYSGITIKNSTVTNSGVTGSGGSPANPAAVAIKARRDNSYAANPASLTNVTIDGNTISGPQNGIRIGEPNQTNDGTLGVLIQKNNLSATFGNKAVVNRTAADVTFTCNYHGTSTDYDDVASTLAAVGTGKNLLNSIATSTDFSSCVSPTGVTLAANTPVCVSSPFSVTVAGLPASTTATVFYTVNNGTAKSVTASTDAAGTLMISETLPVGSYTLTVTTLDANNIVAALNPPLSVTGTVAQGAVAGTVTGSSTVAVGGTTNFTNTGGDSGGTWSSSDPTVATVNNSGVVTGVGSGTASIIYSVTGCNGVVSAQADVTARIVPDLTPIAYALPTSLSAGATFTFVVDIVDLTTEPSSGLVTVYVNKNSQITLSLPATATSVGGQTVQNEVWTLDATSLPNYYVLTTMAAVPAGDRLSFGLNGVIDPAGSAGILSISATILSNSGGEVRAVNNVDAEKIKYTP